MYAIPFVQGPVVLDGLLDTEALDQWEESHAAPEFSSTPALPVSGIGVASERFEPETWARVAGSHGECIAAHWYRQIIPDLAMPWHRDADYFHQPVWCLWIALETVGPENGGLQFEGRTFSLAPGQAIAFSGELLHRTTPVLAPVRRASLVLHFQ